MMGKAKYKPDGPPLTPVEAFAEILAGRPIYDGGKVQTAGWTRSWQVNYLINVAAQRRVRRAVLK